MLFGLFPYKYLIVFEDPLLSNFTPFPKFAVEVLGSPIVYDTELDEAGERSSVKGISFTAILYDNSQFGNHQLWSAEVTKEEKLARLHTMFESPLYLGPALQKGKAIWKLVNVALNSLGISSVRITRLQARIEREQIAVVIDLEVINTPQEQADARNPKKLADGTELTATQIAAAAALTKGAAQVAKDASIWAKMDAIAGSTFKVVGGWFEG